MKFSISGLQHKQPFCFEGDFEEGASVALIGESGAGKTTFLRYLAGFERNRTSHVYHQGILAKHSWQYSVCLVHQQPTMFRHHTVAQTLEFAQQYRKSPIELPKDQWVSQLELDNLLQQPSVQLSGGQQQRVALLRALVSAPHWLLLDESFSALDEKRLLNACAVIQDFKALTNVGLIVASHNDFPQRYLCDQAFVVNNLQGHSEPNLFAALDQNRQQLGVTTLAARVAKQEGTLLKLLLDDQPLFMRPPLGWREGVARLSLAAKDISLALGDTHQTSMVNRLKGRIVKADFGRDDSVLVSIQLNKQIVRSSISTWSWQRLGLSLNQIVFAEFKVGAVQWNGQQPISGMKV